MTVSAKLTGEQYLRAFETRVRQFSPQEQRFGGAIYRELAKGAPVGPEQLRQALGISNDEVHAVLQRDPLKSFIHWDKQGRILGFAGLSTVPTHHHFELDGRSLFTWCAGDALFLPAYLGQAARVESRDPESGELVQLTIAPDRIESMAPQGAAISFIQPESDLFATSAENLQKSYCHFIFFFASQQSGERWITKHPGTFLYSLEEGFRVSKELAVRVFGAVSAQ